MASGREQSLYGMVQMAYGGENRCTDWYGSAMQSDMDDRMA